MKQIINFIIHVKASILEKSLKRKASIKNVKEKGEKERIDWFYKSK